MILDDSWITVVPGDKRFVEDSGPRERVILKRLESKNEELTKALFNANDSYEALKVEKEHLEERLRYTSIQNS